MDLKKLLSYLVVAAIMISAATFVSSCAKDGDKGDKGDKGEQGEEGPEGPTNTFVVTFDFDNGTTVTQTVLGGGWAVQPPTPKGAAFIPETAGLYAGAPPAYTFAGWQNNGEAFNFTTPVAANITLTAHWAEPDVTPIGAVTANDLDAAVVHINVTPGEYTLLIDDNINAGAQTLNVANVKLTIIGIGGERTIQYTGADNARFFDINNSVSLTLGNNITLRGRENGSSVGFMRVLNGNLIMLVGSKITGDNTSSVNGGIVTISGVNSSFTMQGGEITGNHNRDGSSASSGGVRVGSSATFTITGGSITGNTRKDAPNTEAMDVVLDGAAAIANASKTGGTIGVSIPAEFAGN